LDDAAANLLPSNSAITSGTYRPSNLGLGKTYPAPAPTGPYASGLATFNGSNPNGTWSLYVVDDSKGDTGTLLNGWSLNINTQSAAPGTFVNSSLIGIPSIGAALVYPSTVTVAGLAGTVNKLSVTLNSLSHTWPKDVGALLVGPAGQKVVLMANVGAGNKIANVTLTLDDAATASLPLNATLTSGTYKPTNAGTGKVYPAPAPAGPYASALAAFNGTNPNGTWFLYIVDDSAGDSGTLAGGWTLNLTTSTGLMSVAHAVGDEVATVPVPPVVPTVAPAVIFSAQPGVDGEFTIYFSTQAGQVYTIQASSNNRDWVSLGSVQALSESTSFTDQEAEGNAMRFYRVLQGDSNPVATR
jgi:subtilisin-like proprotein convertase family protein